MTSPSRTFDYHSQQSAPDSTSIRRSALRLLPGVLLVLVLVLAITGCGKRETEDSGTPDAPVVQPQDTQTPTNLDQGDNRSNIISFKPGLDVQLAIQEELILTEPGAVIQLQEGRFEFTSGLSLDVDHVTLRGAGMNKTILSFENQDSGAEGLYITSDHVLVEDLTIINTKGNGLKSHTSNDIVIRRVQVEWTGGPKTTNGAYGIYPVNSTNVLIEDCTAIGASDAGIYVGQSKNIMIRNCTARYNVAGFEIENCHGGEAVNNLATKNTGGFLIFDLPDLPMRRGHAMRIHHNRLIDNNTPNFAPKGNIVGTIPTGTGMMIMANENVEVFENEIRDHGTVNLLINSYLLTGIAIHDSQYNPYPDRVHIHDNQFGPCGNQPGNEGGQFVAGILGIPLPDILWDGMVAPEKQKETESNPGSLLCIHDNAKVGGGQVTFANLGGADTLADPSKAEVSRDLAPYTGDMPHVQPIQLPGADP